MNARWLIIAFFLMGCQSSSVADESVRTTELLKELPAIVEEQREAWHIPGLAVGIVKDGETIFLYASGYRNRENQLPVTTRTLFPIASCSKAFTALGAALAEQEGLLDWEIPIHKYVPGFETMNEQTTAEADLRDLLQHHSGYGDYRYLSRLTGATRDEVFQRLKYLEAEGEFRKNLIYSNLGYTLAGYVVGKASNTAWEAFTAQRIFEPLQMDNTVFTVTDMERTGNYAMGYLNLLNWDNPMLYGASTLTTFAPAGGIVSDIEDMVKWLKFNMGDGTNGNHQMVSPEKLETLHRPHTDLSSNPDAELVTYQGYGYGWWTETYRGYNHVHHGGLGNGYISQVSFIPEEGIGVVVLTNLYYAHLHQAITYYVFDRLLGLPDVDHFGRELKQVHAYISNWSKEYDAFWDDTGKNPPPSLEIEEFTGQYVNPAFDQVSVTLQNGKLNLTFKSGVELSLRHYYGNTFATEDDGMHLFHKLVKFEEESKNSITAFTIPIESAVEPIRFIRCE